MANSKPISIHLATINEVVLDSTCIIPIVFNDISGHSITLHISYQIIKNLSYDIVLSMNCLTSTNPIIDWVACSF